MRYRLIGNKYRDLATAPNRIYMEYMYEDDKPLTGENIIHVANYYVVDYLLRGDVTSVTVVGNNIAEGRLLFHSLNSNYELLSIRRALGWH